MKRLAFLLAILGPAVQGGEYGETIRVPAKSITSVSASPDTGRIELTVGGVVYTYFIRNADPEERRQAVAQMVAGLKRAALVEMEVMDIGTLHKAVVLKLIEAGAATAASPAKARLPVYDKCRTTPRLTASLTGREALVAAIGEARAWRKDSRLHQLISLEPLDPQGRSREWLARFWSAEAGEVNSIHAGGPALHCSANAATEPTTLDTDPTNLLDTARLYALGQAEGGSSYTEEGYAVKAALGWIQGVGAVWEVTYEAPAGYTGQKTMRFDARSGEAR